MESATQHCCGQTVAGWVSLGTSQPARDYHRPLRDDMHGEGTGCRQMQQESMVTELQTLTYISCTPIPAPGLVSRNARCFVPVWRERLRACVGKMDGMEREGRGED
jgi:hypothetical protein